MNAIGRAFSYIVLAGILTVPVLAEDAPVGPGPYVATPKAAQPVYYHIGPLNLTVPWDEVNAVYLFDIPTRTSLMGGEAVIAQLWNLQGTAGAVISDTGEGSPFVGGNLWFPNPLPQVALLSQIKPGIFAGWDINRNSVVWGAKASMNIF